MVFGMQHKVDVVIWVRRRINWRAGAHQDRSFAILLVAHMLIHLSRILQPRGEVTLAEQSVPFGSAGLIRSLPSRIGDPSWGAPA